MRTDLIQDALAMALRGEQREQVTFHSDRGTQGGFNRWKQHRARESAPHHPVDGLHRVGWDDAMAESILATRKTEFYHRRAWPSREVGAWIEDRCNRRRRHTSLGQLSPVDFKLHYSNPNADFARSA